MSKPKSAEKKTPKSKLPVALRNAVWSEYIGAEVGSAKCFCCGREPILRSNYECGHVTSRAKGGSDTLDNLRPICGGCNKSMGTQNMFEFAKKCGFTCDTSVVRIVEGGAALGEVKLMEAKDSKQDEPKNETQFSLEGRTDKVKTLHHAHEMTLNKNTSICGVCATFVSVTYYCSECTFFLCLKCFDTKPDDKPVKTETKAETKTEHDSKVIEHKLGTMSDADIDDLFELSVGNMTRVAKEAALLVNAQKNQLPTSLFVLVDQNVTRDVVMEMCRKRKIVMGGRNKAGLVELLEKHASSVCQNDRVILHESHSVETFPYKTDEKDTKHVTCVVCGKTLSLTSKYKHESTDAHKELLKKDWTQVGLQWIRKTAF